MQLDVRGLGHQALDERWQELEKPGIDDTEVDGSARGAWIKYNVFAAQRRRAIQDLPNQALQTKCLGGWLHATGDANKQRILEIAPQLSQRFAQRRLRHVEFACCRREAVFP